MKSVKRRCNDAYDKIGRELDKLDDNEAKNVMGALGYSKTLNYTKKDQKDEREVVFHDG